MPETAVDEDNLAPTGEDEVGRSGQVTAVQTEAVAKGVDEASDRQFNARVL